MSDSKVSELTSATSVGVADSLYIVQSDTSKKVTTAILFANAANVTLKGNINLDSSVQTISSAGTTVDLTKPVTHLAAGASGGSIIIPSGTTNQIKYITMISTSGGSFAISANIANSQTITFSAVGKTAQLLYTNGKWHMVGGTASIT
jgi:monoamine oxidase